MQRVFQRQPHRAVELMTIVNDRSHVLLDVKSSCYRVHWGERVSGPHGKGKAAGDDLLASCEAMLNRLKVAKRTSELLPLPDVPDRQIQGCAHQTRGLRRYGNSPQGEHPPGSFLVEGRLPCRLANEHTKRIGYDAINAADVFV